MIDIKKIYNSEEFPFVAIFKRPTDEDIKLLQVDPKKFAKMQREYELPNLIECIALNKKYAEIGEDDGMFPPFILQYIKYDTKRFLDLFHYIPWRGDYKQAGDFYYKIEENIQ